MKAEFLKLAGVKSEKAFYKKYPTEAAFFKAHPEAKKMTKKAEFGNIIPLEAINAAQNFSLQDMLKSQMMSGGVNNNMFNNMMGQYGPRPAVQSVMGNLKPAGVVNNFNAPAGMPNISEELGTPGFDFDSLASSAGNIIGGIQSIQDGRKRRKEAEKWANVTGVQARAAETEDIDDFRQYSENMNRKRRAFMPVNTGEEFFPIYGVGTNVLAKNGKLIKKAQSGIEEVSETDYLPADWFKEGIDREEIDREVYYEPDLNQVSEEAASIENYNRDQFKSTATFDSNSARDVWVHKTGLPWSEAKRLGYTDGSAKNNIKLLGELKDPRFNKENLRTTPPKKSSQARTPIQHRDTPTGKLAPIKKPLTMDEYFKGKPKYKKDQGDIQVPDEGNMITRVGERLANPLQTFGNLVKYKELPAKGFSKNEKNIYDQVLGIINPFYWANAIGNSADYIEQKEYKKAAFEAADALPALGKLKYTKYIPLPKALPPASVRRAGYLGEGAKRLPQAPPKRLNQPYTPNFVMYQDGGMVGGNPTEIQNTYSPNYDIYSDLEYEPLYNVNQVKSYQSGGSLPWQSFGKLGGMGAASLTGNDGGGQVGGTLGSVAGSLIGGPIGGAIGETLGTLVGGLLDTNDRDRRKAEARIRNNQNRMIASQMKETNKQMFGSYMEDGGYVSNDWNPQVIAKFGELDEQDFARFAHKDEFRAGGHLKKYTAPSERAMQTFAMGGELQTHWGGYAEPMSYNPYLPDGGETVMFRGKSHEEYSPNGETGIGITYGDNPVEVERGEPAVKLKDGGTGEDNLTVYGNLVIPFGEGKGKKFKNYVADLSKVEARQNKLIDKSTNELDALNIRSSFDKLKLASLEANIKGGNMKLKEIADKKINAADLQNAINETAEEYGLVADDLARGKVKVDKKAMKEYAEFGGKFTKAQGGIKAKFNSEKEALAAGYIKDANGFYRIIPPEKLEPVETKFGEADKDFPRQSIDKQTGFYGGITGEKFAETQKNNPWFNWAGFNPNNKSDVERFQREFNKKAESIGSNAKLEVDGKFGKQTASAVIDEKRKVRPSVGRREEAEVLQSPTEPIPYERSGLIDFANQLLPFIRPTDQEELDPTQLMGEMFALSTNKLEPVQAQPYTPQLRVPFDISRQAAKNDLIAQTRAAQRMAQGNPAMQAMIAAQAYDSMQQLNEQDFIDNQRMKDAVYSGNIATLNDAELKNLAIYDQQYERQEAAKSNTKATAQAALNSIADKYAKNRLENRTLGVYENLYNYRYDDRGRAINMNPLFQPNIPTVGGVDATQKQVPVKDASGKVLYYQLEEYDPSAKGGVGTPPLMPVKNGKSIVKKNNKNSSIVKAIKNL